MVTLRNNQKLQMKLAGAVATTEATMTLQYTDDEPNSTRSTSRTVIKPTTGGTTVDLLVGNYGGRTTKSYKFYNNDTTTVTVTFQVIDNGTTRILHKQTLLTGETAGWNPERGWHTLAVDGSAKTTAANDTSASSQAVSAALIAASGSSQASSIAAAIVPASINSVSSQASSIALAVIPASVNSVSSQASSIAAAVIPASVNSVSSQASSMQAIYATISSVASRTKSSFSW